MVKFFCLLRHGFLLPPSFIEPVGKETWEFHKTVAMAILEEDK